jgi:hypothetical protein
VLWSLLDSLSSNGNVSVVGRFVFVARICNFWGTPILWGYWCVLYGYFGLLSSLLMQ